MPSDIDPRGKYLVRELGPRVEAGLAPGSPGRRAALAAARAFRDRSVDSLAVEHVGRRLYIRPADLQPVLDACGGDEAGDLCRDLVRRHSLTDPSWALANDPKFWLLTLAIRQAVVQKDAELAESVLFLLACQFYAIRHPVYFRYPPKGTNEAVLRGVIADLSHKFNLKQGGSAEGLIRIVSGIALSTYSQKLVEGTDLELRNFFTQVHGRVNKALKSISNLFYERMKDPASARKLWLDRAEGAEGEDGRPIGDKAATHASAQVSAASRKVSYALIQEGAGRAELSAAATAADVSVDALTEACTRIARERPDDVEEVISLMLEIWYRSPSRPRGSTKSPSFVASMLQEYAKSNTKDEATLSMKGALDRALVACSPRYAATAREASRAGLRKGLYVWLVLSAQRHAE